jgi:hypothetical protein
MVVIPILLVWEIMSNSGGMMLLGIIYVSPVIFFCFWALYLFNQENIVKQFKW